MLRRHNRGHEYTFYHLTSSCRQILENIPERLRFTFLTGEIDIGVLEEWRKNIGDSVEEDVPLDWHSFGHT